MTQTKGHRPRVLLVDDYPDAREMYSEYLDFSGFDVIEATNGIEALQRAADDAPDIILMDLSLPAPGGIETTQRIKRELPACGIIVLAQTEAEDALYDAIKAGAAAFIPKGVGFSLFTAAAFLMIVGYLGNDTVVVYVRVRENAKKSRAKEGFAELMNRSMNQTLSRTVLTGGRANRALTIVTGARVRLEDLHVVPGAHARLGVVIDQGAIATHRRCLPVGGTEPGGPPAAVAGQGQVPLGGRPGKRRGPGPHPGQLGGRQWQYGGDWRSLR